MYNLDVESPADVAVVLLRAAKAYRGSVDEVEAAVVSGTATDDGKLPLWRKIASILEDAAEKVKDANEAL